MALISRALEHFSVREDLKQGTADLDVGKHHPMSSLLEQLIGSSSDGRRGDQRYRAAEGQCAYGVLRTG